MSANVEQLLTALKNIAQFAQGVGAKKEAAVFEELRERLQAEKRVSKRLEADAFNARGEASVRIPSHIRKQKCDPAKKDLLAAEFFRLRRALADALLSAEPAAFAETTIQGLAGNDEYTNVWGDPKSARTIAERAVEVVQRFSAAVFKQDVETAYGLCANELRNWMSVKRLLTELEKADRNFGGKALACKIGRISHIEADEFSRQKSGNSRANWPKDTPKSNKRATVGTFWFTNPAEKRGRWVMFWITEERDGYRVAKFNQYLQ